MDTTQPPTSTDALTVRYRPSPRFWLTEAGRQVLEENERWFSEEHPALENSRQRSEQQAERTRQRHQASRDAEHEAIMRAAAEHEAAMRSAARELAMRRHASAQSGQVIPLFVSRDGA